MTLLNFGGQINTKMVFLNYKKNENYDRILHIQVSVDSKFQIQQAILIFGTDFQKEVYFWSKTEKNEHHC